MPLQICARTQVGRLVSTCLSISEQFAESDLTANGTVYVYIYLHICILATVE